jgi:hypothetical protein
MKPGKIIGELVKTMAKIGQANGLVKIQAAGMTSLMMITGAGTIGIGGAIKMPKQLDVLPPIPGQGLQGFAAPFEKTFDIAFFECFWSCSYGAINQRDGDSLPFIFAPPPELPMKKIYASFIGTYGPYNATLDCYAPNSATPTRIALNAPDGVNYWAAGKVSDSILVTFKNTGGPSPTGDATGTIAPLRWYGDLERMEVRADFSLNGGAAYEYIRLYVAILSTKTQS